MKCPFCTGSVENAVFTESDNFRAIYNIAPILPGHSLIIPKKHIESALDLNDEQLKEMILFTRSTTSLLLDVFTAEGFNWSLQDRETAGQTLAHLHMHIVLRYRNDLPDPGNWYPRVKQNFGEILDSASRKKLDPEEMEMIVVKLKKAAQK